MTETTETSATRWRKKPVVVEARQLTTQNGPELWEWADSKPTYGTEGFVDGLAIYTLEGRMRADFGDWIIKGVQGEFYPCKPDIFAATYEPACRVCDGSGKLTVPDAEGESASEQACPDPIHDPQPAPELAAAIAVNVSPGDTVVIAPGRPLDEGEARQIGEMFADIAPGVGVIIGLDVETIEVRKPSAGTEQQPAPDPDSQQRYIDQLHDLVRDMLQSLPDTADEQDWRDRAGRLYVHDTDGQPYRAYTEEDL